MKKNNPLVSVLVPVYNVSEYLKLCLDSLINQTLHNIEIICVNDGSTDRSLQILNEYAVKDGRVKIITKQNGGLPSARNAGLDAACGEYVAFVDGDDFVDTNMYKRMYGVAKRKNADIVVCGGNLVPAETDANRWIKETLSTRNRVYRNGGTEALFSERGARPFLWRDLIRRDVIEKNKIRLDESIVVGEDQAFQFKIFPVARKVIFISDKLYYYRYCRPESIMNGLQCGNYDRRVLMHINLLDSVSESWRGRLSLCDSAVPFLEWAVDFIYWDIVRVSPAERCILAKKFCNILIGSGYFFWDKYYSDNTRKHFNYIYEHISIEARQPAVSVVVIADRYAESVWDFIDSLLAQTEKDIEVLLYSDYECADLKGIVQHYLCSDPRICLRLCEKQAVWARYNDALMTAKGKYICFPEYGYIRNTDWLKNAVNVLDDAETDLAGYSYKSTGKVSVEDFQTTDCRQFFYKLDKIRAKGLKFENYSVITGNVFFVKYLTASRYGYLFNTAGEMNREDMSICYADMPVIFNGATIALELAKENNLCAIGYDILKFLNSNKLLACVDEYLRHLKDNRKFSDVLYEGSYKNFLNTVLEVNKYAFFDKNGKAVLDVLRHILDI